MSLVVEGFLADRWPHILRVDAKENRELLLEAARSLFSKLGLDVPMREVARHAGVGPVTLYRRFPSKQDLVVAAFDDELRSDVMLDDLALVLMAGRGLSGATLDTRLAAARRFSSLAIEAFRRWGAGDQLPPPVRVVASMLT